MILSNIPHPISVIIPPHMSMKSNDINMNLYGFINHKRNGFINNILGENKTTAYLRSNILQSPVHSMIYAMFHNKTLHNISQRNEMISLSIIDIVSYDDCIDIFGETIVIGS